MNGRAFLLFLRGRRAIATSHSIQTALPHPSQQTLCRFTNYSRAHRIRYSRLSSQLTEERFNASLGCNSYCNIFPECHDQEPASLSQSPSDLTTVLSCCKFSACLQGTRHAEPYHSAFAAASFRISSVLFRKFLGFFFTLCQNSPCRGSASTHLASISAFFSSVPCCSKNL